MADTVIIAGREAKVYQSTKEDHDFHDMLDRQDYEYMLSCLKLKEVVTISGSGPVALAGMFRHIAEYGIRNILKMEDDEFRRLFANIKCEDTEVQYISQELLLTRQPTHDIETAYKKFLDQTDVYWTSVHPGKMFTPRFMQGFVGSAYYESFATDEEASSPRDIVRAWFSDLRYGVYVVCRDVVVSHFDERHAKTTGREFAKFFREFIEREDLLEEFALIPEYMLRQACLWKTHCAMSR